MVFQWCTCRKTVLWKQSACGCIPELMVTCSSALAVGKRMVVMGWWWGMILVVFSNPSHSKSICVIWPEEGDLMHELFCGRSHTVGIEKLPLKCYWIFNCLWNQCSPPSIWVLPGKRWQVTSIRYSKRLKSECLKPQSQTSCFSCCNEQFPPCWKYVREIAKSNKLIHFSAILLLNCNETDNRVNNTDVILKKSAGQRAGSSSHGEQSFSPNPWDLNVNNSTPYFGFFKCGTPLRFQIDKQCIESFLRRTFKIIIIIVFNLVRCTRRSVVSFPLIIIICVWTSRAIAVTVGLENYLGDVCCSISCFITVIFQLCCVQPAPTIYYRRPCLP